MAVQWSTPEDAAHVDAIVAAHPADSGRCREAALGVLPLAQKLDGGAAIAKLIPKPGMGRFVCPVGAVDRRWSHHFSVHVCDHFVDALTGRDGTLAESYLTTHWQYSDALTWVKPERWEVEQSVDRR